MLSPDVIEFLHSRRISVLCTRDGDNRPSIHEHVILSATDDRVIGLVPFHLAGRLERNVALDGIASMLASRQPGDHRSVQLKGRLTILDAARPHPELFAPVKPYMMRMFAWMMPEADAEARVDALARAPSYRVQFDVAQVFDQSPGPGAGRRIAGGAS